MGTLSVIYQCEGKIVNQHGKARNSYHQTDSYANPFGQIIPPDSYANPFGQIIPPMGSVIKLGAYDPALANYKDNVPNEMKDYLVTGHTYSAVETYNNLYMDAVCVVALLEVNTGESMPTSMVFDKNSEND